MSGPGFLVFVLLHPNVQRFDSLLTNGLKRGVDSGKDGAAIAHSVSLKRVTSVCRPRSGILTRIRPTLLGFGNIVHRL